MKEELLSSAVIPSHRTNTSRASTVENGSRHPGKIESSASDYDDEASGADARDVQEIIVEKKPRFLFEQVQVKDVADLYPRMLEALGQKAIKKVLQAWIQAAHPRKQGQNPYNGGKGLKKEHPDFDPKKNPGKYTAPEYWPSQLGWEVGLGCRHREPHHLKKPGQYLSPRRLPLLILNRASDTRATFTLPGHKVCSVRFQRR